MKKFAEILIPCVLAALIAGCASSATTRFYMLCPVSKPAKAEQANYSVSVGPVTVPAVIDRQQIVVRTGANQVFIDEYERWASPLKDNIGRVIAEDISVLLGTSQITLFPQSTAAGASYRAMIDIVRFDLELGKAATLDALWNVSSAAALKDGKSQRGRTTITEPVKGGSYAELVAAQSLALGKLSADLAGAIQAMESQKTKNINSRPVQ
jgi:hypothetical protein